MSISIMDTKENSLAIMRREDETGPTPGKNRRYGPQAVPRAAATRPSSSRKGGINQHNLKKIPIVNMPARSAVTTGGTAPALPTTVNPHAPGSAKGSPRRPKLPRIPA